MMYWILEGKLGTCALCEETPEGAIIVDVRDLEDNWNEPEEIRKKVKIILKAINMGQPVIIRCMAGISRSNALAVTTLCRMNGKNWNENEMIVRQLVKRFQINMSLRDACKKAVRKGK